MEGVGSALGNLGRGGGGSRVDVSVVNVDRGG